ncbi:MAG: acyl-CoA synthetase [Actinobacteria bacterium]|nr:acyl-CoA synthetase [Actinomycetota bacterium]
MTSPSPRPSRGQWLIESTIVLGHGLRTKESGADVEFTLGQVNDAVAAAVPDRIALVHGDRRYRHDELAAESRRLASALHRRGFGIRTERGALAGHESGQDHLALYLHNGPEYIVGMLGASKARLAPLNVNYRYVAEELAYLLRDSSARVVVYHDRFAATLAEVLDDVDGIDLLVQVPDETAADLLPGAVRWDDLLAEGDPDDPAVAPEASDPDDLYILYTGGTTGMPKGVLWRQHDIFVGAMGGRPFGAQEPLPDLDAVVDAARNGGMVMLTAAPLMHGAAQWFAFIALHGGGTLVLAPDPTRFDAAEILATATHEGAATIQVVGDAMARPLVEELERGSYDLSGLFALGNGGAALSPGIKERFLEQVPHALIVDTVGSSETGAQMGHTSMKGAASTGVFAPGPETTVVTPDLTAIVPTDDTTEIGWLAQRGHVPLGYLGDATKTAATFPTIDGVRFSVPGDRARRTADGSIELLGRDSQTINSGGEKVFVEEVEQALLHHPAVDDVVVVGRPSDRWGQEVVAIVQLHEGVDATADELIAEAGNHVARYKLPRAVLVREHIERSPAGKADYRWARSVAEAATGEPNA